MKLAVALYILPMIAVGQSAETPNFLAADVKVSAKTQNQNQFMRPPSTRGPRYEIKNASMVDLVGLAYGFTANKILGGPSWLELDRFDVLAKQPPQTAPDAQKLMLKALLAERFKLVVREDTKPVPSYALTLGKNLKLKKAEGGGDTGCQPQGSAAPPGPGDGTLRLMLPGPNGGAPVQISIVGGVIEFKCRNMTIAAFAEGLRGMIGANLGVNPILDQTGLTDRWNFDLRYSIGLIGLPGMASGEQITISDAIDKQLGLKLEERQVPTRVLIVESVNQKPSANPPGTAEALPPNVAPTEFEVATVKPTDPGSRNSRFQMQPGGRLTAEGMPFRFLLSRAFDNRSSDQLVGVPSWADSARFDVIAKAPSDGPALSIIDQDAIAPMMLALLKDRFKLSYHTEEREMTAYNLVAAKPKMTKADPSARAWCKNPNQIPGAPPAPSGSQALVCQNITMAQFAELLRGRAPGMEAPILDSTGIEGGWDFRLTFNPILGLNLPAALRDAPVQPGVQGPSASDPAGGYTIFEALEKQLGLKLVKTKRPGPVFVIDHVEQTPTEN